MSDEIAINYSSDIKVKVRHNQEVSVELASQGPQGPQGEKGATGDVTPTAIAARDAAVTAATESRAAADEVKGLAADARADATYAASSRQAAATSATNAAASAVNANDAAANADAYTQAALAARTASIVAKEDAQAAQVAAETARADAQGARDAADIARAQSVQARTDAQTARGDAQAAAVDADAAAVVAEEHRLAAEQFAQEAAASAAEAAQFDPSSYPTKQNNGSDFADPAQVRANIGAAAALEDITKPEAEAGASTVMRNWNSLRVREAIAAYAPAKSHGHAVADISGLQDALGAKAPLASPAFSGAPTVPTAVAGDRSLQIANTEYVRTALDEIIGAAPGTLDTLQEIADALGDDPNFAATMTQQLATKADNGHQHVIADITDLAAALDQLATRANPTFTGTVTVPTAEKSSDTTVAASTAFVKTAIADAGLAVEGHKHDIADINGLQLALDGKAANGHAHVMADITDLAAALALLAPKASPALTGTPTAPTQAAGNNSTRIATTAFVATAVANGVSGKADMNHTHVAADITDLQPLLDQKAALNHGHAISGITGLSDALAAKADAETVSSQLASRYTKNEVDLALSGYYTKNQMDLALNGKAASAHGHTIANITDLQTTLDAKLGLSGGTLSGELLSTSANAYRLLSSNYGAFLRNDDASFYLLFTASGDRLGTWNSLRPFTVSLTTGGVTMGHGLSVTGNITASGNVTGYSDARLKSDIEQIDGALDMLDQVRGVRFTMNGERSIGVIAQELQAVAPELVHEADDEDKTLSVAYGNITGILIEAVKELRAEVAELKRAA